MPCSVTAFYWLDWIIKSPSGVMSSLGLNPYIL